jgi:hypothetical protein
MFSPRAFATIVIFQLALCQTKMPPTCLLTASIREPYQRRAEKHLRRYLGEFDFRYSNRIALCF